MEKVTNNAVSAGRGRRSLSSFAAADVDFVYFSWLSWRPAIQLQQLQKSYSFFVI